MRASWPDDLGRVARQRRLDLGWSQEGLAARADVTRQWLTRFETGKGDPSLSKVLRVLRELQLGVDIAPEDQLAKKRISPAPALVIPKIDTSGLSAALAQFAQASARMKLPDPAATEAFRAQMAATLERLAATQRQMRAPGRSIPVARHLGEEKGGHDK
jgi:transcriptional regulator with XRE-family HTH domain